MRWNAQQVKHTNLSYWITPYHETATRRRISDYPWLETRTILIMIVMFICHFHQGKGYWYFLMGDHLRIIGGLFIA